jgi:hypothetical protein
MQLRMHMQHMQLFAFSLGDGTLQQRGQIPN